MKGMSLELIAKACQGTYVGDESKKEVVVTGVTTDSRQVLSGNLFIPVVGARVDGHDFIPSVVEAGACCCLSEKKLEHMTVPYILVDSTLQAIKDLAEYYRSVLDVKVVGITGSVGKTSTKEMIASILSQKYSVLKTLGNFNNELGLPFTIFRIRDEEVAVLEMGISDFGEMHRLSKIARPDICVMTNIGDCHLENLGDRNGVLKAKSEIFDYFKEDGAIVLNGDDTHLATVPAQKGVIPERFGINTRQENYADHVVNQGLNGTDCEIHMGESSIHVHIAIPGHHMVYNALAGACVGKNLGLSLEQIKAGIETLRPVGGRNHIIQNDSMTIIDDCYNANPVSMKASIDVLSTALGKKIAILGDMFELGDKEEELHREVGAYAAKKGIDRIICVGSLSKYMAEEASLKSKTSEVVYLKNKERLFSYLEDYIDKGSTILVKASNGMKFAEVVEILKDMKPLR